MSPHVRYTARNYSPARNRDNTDSMKRQTVITQKKRGPPPTGKGTLVGVRLQPDDLAAVDDWAEKQKEPHTRPEAIRALVRKGLKGKREG